MTLVTIPKPAERLAWLRERHSYFNASAAACLYDCHPHINLGDVAIEKLADEPPDKDQTEAMERGDRLEPVLLDWFGDGHGVQVVASDVLYANGRLMATLDGEPAGGEDWWVEVKTTMDRWDDVPRHVYWQMCAQAAASGKRKGWCVWLDADMRLKSALVEPALEHVADVIARAETFMAFVDLGMVPEGVQMSADQVVALHPKPEVGKWVDIDADGLQAVRDWEEARQARIAAEKREGPLKDAVARLLTDAEGAKYNGMPVATWKQNKATVKTDYKALAERLPRTVARFEREYPGPRVLRSTKALTTFNLDGVAS